MMTATKRKEIVQLARDYVNFYKKEICEEIKKGVYFESKDAINLDEQD